MDTPALLEIRGLTKEYPGVRALNGVDFEVRPGEAVEPTDGEILLDGEPLTSGNPSASIARGVATIYQELDLVADLRVVDNIFLGHELRKRGFLDRARMRRALEGV